MRHKCGIATKNDVYGDTRKRLSTAGALDDLEAEVHAHPFLRARVDAVLQRTATAEKIGAAVVYLAGEAARSISGVTLRIDGAITSAGT